MRLNGNIKSNQKYNPDPRSHPVPTDGDEGERNSQMARYLAKKYRDKAFMQRKPREREVARERRAEPVQEAAHDRSHAKARPQTPPAATVEASRAGALWPQDALAREPLSRSATAPLPYIQPTSSPAVANNPFLRQMTASVQPSYAPPASIAQASALYPSSSVAALPPSLGQSVPYTSSWQAQQIQRPVMQHAQSVPPLQGGVWDDLAGLSISSNTTYGLTALHNSSGYLLPTPSANPFLRSQMGSMANTFAGQPTYSPQPNTGVQQNGLSSLSSPQSRNPFFASMHQAAPAPLQPNYISSTSFASQPYFHAQQHYQQ